MRKRVATLLLTLACLLGFAAGVLTAPSAAEAACKVYCCPSLTGDPYCWECCEEPCIRYVCPPY